MDDTSNDERHSTAYDRTVAPHASSESDENRTEGPIDIRLSLTLPGGDHIDVVTRLLRVIRTEFNDVDMQHVSSHLWKPEYGSRPQ